MFFEYEPDFIPWLLSYAVNRPILDVGCGQGGLLRDLLRETIRAHGIDFRRVADEDVANHVTFEGVATARVMRLDGWVHVIARPCHGQFLRAALQRAVGDVLIFTRPSTIQVDAGDLWDKIRLLEGVPGLKPAIDGEPIQCYHFRREPPKEVWEEWACDAGGTFWMKTVKLVSRTVYEGLTGSLSSPPRGLREVIRRTEDDHYRSVPVEHPNGTIELTGNLGIVGPNGELLRCRYFNHDDVIYRHMLLTTEEAELMGWRKIRRTGPELFIAPDPWDDDHSRFPTEAQLHVLQVLRDHDGQQGTE